MNDLFNTILEMNIYASIAILFVIIFRRVFKSFPKKYVCFLWIIVAIRLICPLNSESYLSLLNIKPLSYLTENNAISTVDNDKTPDVYNTIDKVNNIDTGISTISPSENNSKEDKTDINIINTIKHLFCFIWLIVAIILMILLAIQYIKLNVVIKNSKKKVLKDYVELDNSVIPFVYGIINPKIYLPVGLDAEEKNYILLHEKIHIKNRDYVIKFLSNLLLCINWFNPLVWIAHRLLNSDLEMRCDEDVINYIGKEITEEYCLSMVLHATESKNKYRALKVSFAQKSFGGMEVKMRINNLFKKKVSKVIALTAIIASMVATTIITTSAKSNKNKHNKDLKTNITYNESASDNTDNAAKKLSKKVIKKLRSSVKTEDDAIIVKYAEEFNSKGYYLDDYNFPTQDNEKENTIKCFCTDTPDGNNNKAIYIYKSSKKYASLKEYNNYVKSNAQKNISIKSYKKDGKYTVEEYDSDGLLVGLNEYVIKDSVIIKAYCNLNNPKFLG